jgi:hypothetical protein
MDLLRREDMLADRRHHRVEQPGRLTPLRWHSTGCADGTLASYAQSPSVERSSSSPSRA